MDCDFAGLLFSWTVRGDIPMFDLGICYHQKGEK